MSKWLPLARLRWQQVIAILGAVAIVLLFIYGLKHSNTEVLAFAIGGAIGGAMLALYAFLYPIENKEYHQHTKVDSKGQYRK